MVLGLIKQQFCLIFPADQLFHRIEHLIKILPQLPNLIVFQTFHPQRPLTFFNPPCRICHPLQRFRQSFCHKISDRHAYKQHRQHNDKQIPDKYFLVLIKQLLRHQRIGVKIILILLHMKENTFS